MLIHRRFPSGLALPLLLSFLVACASPSGDPGGSPGNGRGGRGGARGAGGSVPVVTARVERQAVPVVLPAVGTVEAISSVQIRSQVTGQLSAIGFAEGQEVQKGQRLFTLDARPFQAALQQAEAVLGRDTATLQNAQAQLARADNLFQRGLIPRDQYDSQRAGVSSLTATVEADKAAIESARLNVQYATIAAPLAGRTGSLGVHAGDLIRANDTSPMVVINQLEPVYVTFSVPGRYLPDVRRYQARKPLPVDVSASGAPGSPGDAASAAGRLASGVVTFIDNAVDAATGTIKLKGTFQNADRRLWPGTFVQVALVLTTEPDALVVPATAVQASQDGQFVYVVRPDRTVDMRKVSVARQQDGKVVVAAGVAAGDVVVTDGQLRLTPGARVTERGDAAEGGQRPGRGGDQPGDGGVRRGDR